MTIPDVTDAEDLVAMQTGSSDKRFNIVINQGATATWLLDAASTGTLIPLVVLINDAVTVAMDDVLVASAQTSSAESGAYMSCELDARDIRFV